MFDGKPYITQGVAHNIPEYLQNLLWYIIEIMDVPQKDHLQVFELQEVIIEGKIKQRILHTQECPPYRKEHHIPVQKAVSAKVFAIDDSDHFTLLLAEEY